MIVTTAEELEALPVGSVVLDRDGWPLWRYPEWSDNWCAANGVHDIEWPELESDGAPFTVVHIPGRDLIAEARAEGIAAAKEGIAADVADIPSVLDEVDLAEDVQDEVRGRAVQIALAWEPEP